MRAFWEVMAAYRGGLSKNRDGKAALQRDVDGVSTEVMYPPEELQRISRNNKSL